MDHPSRPELKTREEQSSDVVEGMRDVLTGFFDACRFAPTVIEVNVAAGIALEALRSILN